MKKLFFFGVFMNCLLFSCKKDNSNSQTPPPPPPIDSFLLHPPPVLDSIQFPLTIGTWWKYQRIDSSFTVLINYGLHQTDSSTEIISVIGKTPYIIAVEEFKNLKFRYRYDTLVSFILEINNTTKGTLDTNYVMYYNSSFNIFPNKKTNPQLPYMSIMTPQLEGEKFIYGGLYYKYYISNAVLKDSTVSVLGKQYSSCIYTGIHGATDNVNGWSNSSTCFLKQGIGFVNWKIALNLFSHYGSNSEFWYYRRLIDYHIAP